MHYHDDRIEQLHTILDTFAPNANVQRAIAKSRSDMEVAGESETAIARMMANILADGLNHGNWP